MQKFKKTHGEFKAQIESWEAEVKEAQWKTPHDLKRRYPKASLLKKQRVVFDIGWNRFRLLVQVSYKNGIVLVKKIGTHKEYDKWEF